MIDQDLKLILEEVFPEECESVGPELLHDLISGKIDFARPEHGRRYDLPDLDTLRDAYFILKILYDVFRALRTKLSRKPTAKELSEAAKEQNIQKDSISTNELDALIKKVADSEK